MKIQFTKNGKTYEADLSYTWRNATGEEIAEARLVKDGVVTNYSHNVKVSAIEVTR